MKWITATFPNLHIIGVARFEGGVFRSTDPEVLARMAPWVGRYGITQVSEDTDPPDLPLRDPWPGAVLDIELFGEDGKVRESVLPPRLSDVELRAAFGARWQANTAYTAGQAAVLPGGSVGVARSTHTSGSSFTPAQWDVPTTGLAQKATQLVDEIRRGKMGRIGTSGKAVAALRFDHKLNEFISTILPLLTARNLPFSIGVVTKSVGNPTAPYEPTTATWADIETKIVSVGGEIWAHSQTHSDGVSQYGGTSLYDEIVTCKTDIETNLPRVRVMGWQQPGSPATYGPPHTSPAAMDDYAGRLIRATYGLYESSLAGTSRRAIPTDGCCGHNHISMEAMSLATVTGVVDEVIGSGIGVEFMSHADNIGQAGFMSLADYTAFLDYLVAKRDAGSLEVVTASALAFADPGSTRWPNLIPGGDFSTYSTGVVPAVFSQTPSAAWTIQTDGGHSGNNYLRIPQGQQFAICSVPTGEYGADGHTFMFEGWTRSLDASPSAARVTITSAGPYAGGANVQAGNRSAIATTSAWQRVRVPVTLRKGYASTYIAFGAQNPAAGTVDWDDVSFRPI